MLGGFLLEEEEVDDELFFVILPAIISYLSEEKRPIHTSSLRRNFCSLL
jgi:hypothetical protein|uniref:Uncharacterized protein n=1 Tax=Zea mays TaxID=4577 RepID=B6UBG6_MAIZE|nr:hypothetical protein [Zea mays]